jgi:hypothetical protein
VHDLFAVALISYSLNVLVDRTSVSPRRPGRRNSVAGNRRVPATPPRPPAPRPVLGARPSGSSGTREQHHEGWSPHQRATHIHLRCRTARERGPSDCGRPGAACVTAAVLARSRTR